MSKKSLMWLVISVAAVLGLVLLLVRSRYIKRLKQAKGTEIQDWKIFQKIARLHFSKSMARLVTAQAMFETGNFTSPAYNQLNNAFGIGGEGRLFGFNNVYDSIKWLRAWLTDKSLPDTADVDTYVRGIRSKGYFTAAESVYLAGMKAKLHEMDNTIPLSTPQWR